MHSGEIIILTIATALAIFATVAFISKKQKEHKSHQ